MMIIMMMMMMMMMMIDITMIYDVVNSHIFCSL